MAKYKIGTDLYDLPEEKVESFLSTYPDAVEITEEIQTDPTEGKTNGAAGVDAAVAPVATPSRASMIVDAQPESTESESVDTSGELQPGEQGYYRQEKRKEKEAKEQVELDNKNKLKQLTSDLDEYDRRLDSITKTKYGEVNPENLATQASVDLYNNLIEKRNNTIKEIDTIEFEQPSILKSYAAQVGRGFANFAKGLSQFQESIQYSLLETALDVFEPDYKGTAEEKQAIMGVIKQGVPTAGAVAMLPPSSAAGKFIEKLEPAIRQYEDITITEEIKEGNYLKAGERAVGAALESIPSLVAAFTGPGGLIALAGSVSGQKFDEEFEKDPDKSTGVLLSNSVGSGVIEASFELVTRGILKKARLLKDSGADKAARDLIRGGSEKLATTLGLNTLKEGGSEAATKVTTLLFDKYGVLGVGGLDKDIDWGKEVYNIVDEGIVGGIMGSGTTLAGSIANTDQAIIERAQTILMPSENKQEIIKSANKISQLFSDKLKTNAEGIIIINEAIASEEAKIQNIRKETNESLYNMTPAELKVYASNQNDLSKLRQQIQDPKQTESVKKIAEQKFKDIRDQNDVLFRESADRRIQRGIELAKKTAEDITGLEIKDFNTTAEVEAFIKEQDPEADVKASEQQGFIIQNPETGEQTIVINKEVSKAEKAVTVSDHELLHSILYKTVKNSPETSINLGNSLLEELNKIDPTKVKDSNFKKRMEQYADQTQEVQMEEAITLFSDAIATGDIQFNENIFTKIGDSIRRVMQRFGVNVKFNNGRDVYNFVKDYNKSLKSGAISKAQIKAAETGVSGELVTPAEQQADEQIIKESRSEEASNRVQEIYEQQGEAGTFEIIEQFKPITSRIVERRSEAPGFDRQLLTDEIETGQRGIIDLIKEYKPESGVPLAAYINKFLPARAIEASKRVLGEEFTEDVTEARGVAAEEVVTETAIKPEAKTIDPFRIMPDVKENATAEVQKSIADKDVDVTEVTYKELKDVAPYQTVADFFNIPVSRIKNPKDNLRKSDDVANIQRWILKNEPTLKNLFTEANRDVVEVTEGNKVIRQGGEPTAIPRNLLNKFYTKGDRVGNNFQWKLKPYDRTTFLEAVGIKDGKVDPNFTPRAAEAQTIKGILDMYTRNLGNVAARDIIEGREDIVPAERARVKAEVAKGKPRLMFAKQSLLDVTQARDINAVLKIVGMDSASVPDSKRAEIQESFLDSIKKHKLTTNVFLAGAFAFSGAKYKRKADGNVYYELTNGEEIIGIARRDSEGNIRRNKNGKKLFDQPTAEQVVEQFGEGVKLLPGKGRLYYGVNDPAYQTALAEANKNSEGKNEGKARRVNINAVNTDKGKAQAEINMQVLDDVVSQLDQAIKNGMPKELAAMVIAQGYQATTGLIKIAAPFRYFSKNPQYGTSLKQKTGDKFREEHNPPASVVGASIIYGFATNNTSQIMADIKKNYYQTKLSKADDQKLDDAKLDATLPVGTTITDNPAIRFIEAGIDLNSIVNYETGQTMAEELGVALKPSDVNVETVFEQNKILKEVLSGGINAKTGQNRLNEIAKLKSIPKASVSNNNENNTIKFSKEVPNQEVLDNLGNADAAMANARNPKAPVKKIRVFDFDDTLARSNSQVLYEMPDGTTGKLNATQFAERSGELQEQGAEFDFSEFSKVIDGKRGPVFKAIENIVAKRGVEDVFILTARPANAAGPIKEFMDALGVNLPIENIIGLGDGKAEAKARWMTGKAAEGYNDFFFVDDAYKNVKAVQDALEVFDVKSKTQQAKVKFSKAADLDKGFNDILEQSTGIASEKEYKRVKAEVAGASRGMAIRGIPYSAQDFVGLLYETLSKGKLGDAQMAWYKTHLFDPYSRAMTDIDNARLTAMADYRALKKQLGLVPKDLRKKIPGEPFTREQAVRVYIWNQQGTEVPGISKTDLKELTDFVENNAELKVFADQLIAIQKGDEYAKPKEGWPAGSITTDLLEGINTIKRAKYLEQWKENKDIIFSEKNMNKLEAAYGKKYRKALENMLGRMESGRNRNFSDDTLTARFTDWLQGSVGTIMFFNTRSALLQTLSSINFINFTDNNPLAAAKAFANQKQYWSDFVTLINSDFLKARRSGLRMNVNEADIADMAKKGGPKAVVGKLLQLGFAPTQIADSFAIASGGATFYRNRVNTYLKKSKFEKPQVIFLTGAAGSGKTTVAKNFGENFVIIDKDVEMEALMKEAGLPSDLNKLTQKQRDQWREIQSRASKNALAKIKKLRKEGKNIVIDDTGSSEPAIARLKRELEQSGYESKMILLNTPLEKSLKRNKARKQRILTDTTVKNSFEALQGNKKRYKEIFKNNFFEAANGEVSDNLINELTGKMTQKEAESKAFTDFRENAEESQQSARPDRISMQQAGGLGRLILAFQNTPAQYARLIDKSVRDLKNGRGDAKTNISKILYYSTVQNLLFNALQQAMFAFAFDDEEPEDKEKKEKYFDVANGMMDSLLRGTGLAGGVVSVAKNAIIRIVEESEKDRPKFEKVGADLLKIAPPVSSKLSKINQAARSYQWDKKEMQEKGWSLDNPAYLAAANVIAATTNVPLDRVVKKGNNVASATDSDLETWERLALLGGWQDWEIGIDEEKPSNKPQPRKTKLKSRKTKKRKTTTR